MRQNLTHQKSERTIDKPTGGYTALQASQKRSWTSVPWTTIELAYNPAKRGYEARNAADIQVVCEANAGLPLIARANIVEVQARLTQKGHATILSFPEPVAASAG